MTFDESGQFHSQFFTPNPVGLVGVHETGAVLLRRCAVDVVEETLIGSSVETEWRVGRGIL